MDKWRRRERPGSFGAARDRRYAEYDARFGKDRWRIAWSVSGEGLLWQEMASYYEDAYSSYLAEAPMLVNQLCAEIRDVFEDSVSNRESRLDYSRQESTRNHITDIVVRRCLRRLACEFRGNRLLQLATNNPDPLSVALSPGRVPFHKPELIVQPELSGWWGRGTVESFYQSNKVLEVLSDDV